MFLTCCRHRLRRFSLTLSLPLTLTNTKMVASVPDRLFVNFMRVEGTGGSCPHSSGASNNRWTRSGEQLGYLPHRQKEAQRGLLERLEIEMSIEAFSPLVLRIYDHRHGSDVLSGFQTAA